MGAEQVHQKQCAAYSPATLPSWLPHSPKQRELVHPPKHPLMAQIKKSEDEVSRCMKMMKMWTLFFS